ncbi:MAG: hypothetical protein V4506_02060 [Bacteroidota bacterium]
MKVTASISALILLLGVSFQSCRKHTMKEGTTSYQTIEVNLDMNKSYQYSFGTATTSSRSITKQSQAFSMSEIDNVNGSALFNYIPRADFTGTDEVQITSVEGSVKDHANCSNQAPQGNCQQHGSAGHCCQHHDCDKAKDKTIYTFKITIKSVTQPTITKTSNLSVQGS